MDFVKFLFTILRRFAKGVPDSTYTQLEDDWKQWIEKGRQQEQKNKLLSYFFRFQDDFRTKTFLIVFYLFAVKWCLDFMKDKREDFEDRPHLEDDRY
jgi:hypothetical protein